MKKILIWMPSMALGGVEKSLISLLQIIDYQKVSVDIFLHKHEGELFEDIPKEVNVLDEIKQYTCLAEPLINVIKKGHWLIAASRIWGKFLAKQKKGSARNAGISGDYSHRFTKWLMPKIQKEQCYDMAISYVFPHYFVAEKVNAKKKVSWIHTDYTSIKIDINSQIKMWSRYDYIVSISEDVTKSFITIFPELKSKIVLIENILSEQIVLKQMEEFEVIEEMPKDSNWNILSIGRFCEAKNFDNVPNICKQIIESGINVRWYLIGFGAEESLIRQRIVENAMEKHVIILGKKINPYPYLKKCDLYVQPSRYEGKAMTVREAQMIGKPVVITRFSTSSSQVQEGVDGIIVPLDNEGCAKGIVELLLNKERMNLLKKNCQARDYSGKEQIQKIYHLLE